MWFPNKINPWNLTWSASWVTVSFLWSSTRKPASTRSSSPKWTKFTVWVNHHYFNKDHISVLREMMELYKWAVALWYQWQLALQQFGANPTESGLLKLWKAVPPSSSQCRLGLFSRLLRGYSCRDILHVCMYEYTNMCVCVCGTKQICGTQNLRTLWVVALFVHKIYKSKAFMTQM